MKLFEKINVGKIEVQNRIMFPPILNRRKDNYNFTPKDCKDFYVNLAKGGTGIVVIEMTFINHTLPLLIGLHDNKHIEDYKEMIEEMHKESNIKVFVQLEDALPGLCHVDEVPENMEEVFYQNFMSAAVRAKKTEADGIELHGTCRNLSKRMHLVKRILTGMHDVCGKNYPIGIRIDENEFTVRGDTFKQTTGITQELAKEKVAYISLSAERQLHAEKNEYLSKSINKTVFEYKIPIVTTAKTPRAQLAESKLQDFDADIVEICRAILCDPEWPIKSKEGRFNEIRKCSYCNRCMDYPMPRKPTACIR